MSDNDKRTLAEEIAVRYVLTNSDLVWEAMGPDGITYDFNTNILRMDEKERELCSSKMVAKDNAIAATYAYFVSVKDYEAIGRMVVDQFDGYLSHQFKEAEENLSLAMEGEE